MPSAVYLHDGEHQITVTFRKEEDKERFKAHYRALDALAVQCRDELVAERERVRVLREAMDDVRGRICFMSGQASSTALHNAALDVIDAALATAGEKGASA